MYWQRQRRLSQVCEAGVLGIGLETGMWGIRYRRLCLSLWDCSWRGLMLISPRTKRIGSILGLEYHSGRGLYRVNLFVLSGAGSRIRI